MRALIYCRVSSDPLGHGRSVSEQETECRHVCEREGWTVQRVFTDNDRSASRYATKDRPAYKQLVRAVEAAEGDVLVTWEASRFQRDLEDYVRLRELCRKHGVFWSYSGRTYDLSRMDDRLSTGLDALLAERESDITRERILRSVRAGAAAGRPHGRLLYGYQREYDPSSGALIAQTIREDQAAVIREACKRFLAGETTNTIADDFNRRGLPAPRGGTWYLSQIRRLLTNPSYIGKRTHNGKVVGDAQWPAILSEADFYQCAARFSDPRRKTVKDGSVKHLLTGLMVCGVCEGRIVVLKPRGYLTYMCRERWCTARKVWAVDDLITELVLRRLEMPDALEVFALESDAEDQLAVLAEKRARLTSFYDAAGAGEITATALGRIEQKLLGEIEALERRLQRTSAPTVIYDLVKQPRKVWKKLLITQKREVIRTLMDIRLLKTRRGERVLNPETIVVQWRTA